MAKRLRYHHLGVPVPGVRPGMVHLPRYGLWVSDHKDNAFGIQWMYYTPECALPEVVKSRPHLAFEVDDLAGALEGRKVLIPPNSPSPGVTVAFVEEGGEPVEFLQMTPEARAEHGGSDE